MLTVRDIMTPNPISVKLGSTVADAARIMLDKHFNGLPVVNENGDIQGVLCQSDLVAQHKRLQLPSYFVILDAMIPLSSPRKYEEEIKRMAATTVDEAMTTVIRTVSPEDTLEDVASLMVDDKYYTLPVVEKGRLIGVVGKEDVLRTLVMN